MGLGHSPSIPTSGLVFHMDPGSIKSYSGSGTTVTDLSGSGNNGTLVSSPTYQYLNIGRFGFNGTSSYINLGNPSSLKPSVVSACAWVRTTDLNRQSMIVDGNFQNSGQGYLLQFNASNQALFACRLNNSTFNSASGTTSVAANTWYHVVGTYDGTTIKVYVNGVLEGSTAYSGGIGYSGANLAIGVYQSLISGYSLNGYVGPVQIYNRAITAAEVAQIYAAGSSRYTSASEYLAPIDTTSLVLNLDAGNPSSYSGSGTTWTSLTGTNNATLQNGPTFDTANGGTIAFDGTNDYASCASSNDFAFGTGDFTLEMWIKHLPTGSTYTHFFSLPDQNTFGFKAWDNGTRAQIYFYSGAFRTDVSGIPNTTADEWVLERNTWAQIIFMRSSSVAYGYKNAMLKGSKSGYTSNYTAQALNIGWGWGSEYQAKNIAVARIWKRALSQAEITSSFNALRGRFGL